MVGDTVLRAVGPSAISSAASPWTQPATEPTASPGATMMWMTSEPKRVTISGPELAGSYEVVEQRSDGSLLLRPETELLSEVLRETEGAVFRDEEFITHLERVMATEDDLPGERSD
jgi:hypothetical protein